MRIDFLTGTRHRTNLHSQRIIHMKHSGYHMSLTEKTPQMTAYGSHPRVLLSDFIDSYPGITMAPKTRY